MSVPGEHTRPVSPAQWIARAIAIVILVPVRVVWEGVKLAGRALAYAVAWLVRYALVPSAELVWHWVIRPLWFLAKDIVWDWLLAHVLWSLILTPVFAFLLDVVVRPLRRAVERWLWHRILRPAVRWTARWVLRPVAKFLVVICYSAGRWLIVWPLEQVWRWVLRPTWRITRAALAWGWRASSRIVRVLIVVPCVAVHRRVIRPALRVVGSVCAVVIVRPLSWVHRTVVRPMNRWAADIVGTVFGR